MSGCIRQRLGPTKKRLKDRIKQAETFLQQDVSLDETEDKANQLLLKLERNLETYKDLLEQLQEASKEDEAKSQRLENEMEDFSVLALNGDEAICDLKTLLINIAKRKQQTTEEKERAHQQEKLQQEKDLQLAKLNQEKEIQMEKMKLELEMLKQSEIDKQREQELKKLEVELEAKRKLVQTEQEMELKRAATDTELKMKTEMEQNVLNWKTIWYSNYSSHFHYRASQTGTSKIQWRCSEVAGILGFI